MRESRPSASPDGSGAFVASAPRLVLQLAGAAVWAVALVRLCQDAASAPVGVYDEGLLLTDAQLLLAGKVPFRDFYSNYPPGAFLLLAGLFKTFGPSVTAERCIGVISRALASLWAGRLAGQIAGRRFSAVAAGLTMLWLLVIHADAVAYVLAVHGVLLALVLLMRAHRRGGRTAYLLAGAALGAVSWMRHDLFALLVIPLGAGTFAAAVWQRAWRAVERPAWSWLPWLVCGVLLAVVPFWGSLFALVDHRLVLSDLVFDQIRYTLPARRLPMPSLFRFETGKVLPAVLGEPFEGAVGLTLIGPLLAALAIAFPGGAKARGRLGAALLGAFSLAVLPQMTGRTDIFHAVYAVAPALVLIGVLAMRLDALGLGGAALALAAMWPAHAALLYSPPPPGPVQPGFERAGGRPVVLADVRREVLRFIAEHTTSPRDPVYIGLADHRFVYWNEVDLYFFADRVGATRYMQFDPNVVNRLDVQQQMAVEIETSGARVAVLSSIAGRSAEPNDSAKEGADYLDRYLRDHFRTVRVVPPYALMLRRE